MFEVNVVRVNVIDAPAKRGRRATQPRGRQSAQSQGFKKAIVTRTPKQTRIVRRGEVMADQKYTTHSPGRRGMTGYTFEDVTKTTPERLLIVRCTGMPGVTPTGRSPFAIKAAATPAYRMVDFKRDKHDIPAKVAAIEYDPNRTARIALAVLRRRREALHRGPARSEGWRHVASGPNAEIRPGNACRWPTSRWARWSTTSRCSRARADRWSRSAGASAQLLGKEGDSSMRLPSGEMRMVRQTCYATIGQVGNIDHANVKLGKAGRKRHMGIRPPCAARP